jgi:hypothetical protein
MPNYPYTFQLPPLNVQDIPNDGVAGEFLGINGSGVLDWLTAGGGGTGDMLKSENLSGLASYPTARTNLGLGTGDSPTFANLTLTSPSLVSSAPVTISQTWNNAAVAFTGLKVNAVSTDSLTTSRLLDLQAGGVSKFNVDRTGNINVDPTNGSAVLTFKVGAGTAFQYYGGSGWGSQPLNVMAAAGLSVSQGILQLGANTILLRDGADNTLALRNGAAAQTFRVYNTYSNAGADYERFNISFNSSRLEISTGQAGSGVSRKIDFGTYGTTGITFFTNTANRWGINGSDGHFIAAADNTYDIGASGANRPRNVYVGSNIYAAGNVGIGTTAPSEKLHVVGSAQFDAASPYINLKSSVGGNYYIQANSTTLGYNGGNYLAYLVPAGKGHAWIESTNTRMIIEPTTGNVGIGTTSPTSKLHVAGDVTLPNGGSIFFGGGYNIYGTTTATTINGPTAFGQVAVAVNGVTKWVFNYDGLLCGGGTTAAFPAIKRSSTTLQARLADDTAFAPIQGKLTTDTAYTATVVAATGYITIYDSTGTAYRVPCAV